MYQMYILFAKPQSHYQLVKPGQIQITAVALAPESLAEAKRNNYTHTHIFFGIVLVINMKTANKTANLLYSLLRGVVPLAI